MLIVLGGLGALYIADDLEISWRAVGFFSLLFLGVSVASYSTGEYWMAKICMYVAIGLLPPLSLMAFFTPNPPVEERVDPPSPVAEVQEPSAEYKIDTLDAKIEEILQRNRRE